MTRMPPMDTNPEIQPPQPPKPGTPAPGDPPGKPPQPTDPPPSQPQPGSPRPPRPQSGDRLSGPGLVDPRDLTHPPEPPFALTPEDIEPVDKQSQPQRDES